MNKEMKGWTPSLKKQEASPELKKNQRGDLFRTYKNKGKNISSRMG